MNSIVSPLHLLRLSHASIVLSAVCTLSFAADEAESNAVANDEAIELSPFFVTAPQANSYLATNAATGTRIALPIESTPITISVVTSDFLADRGNTSLTDAAALVPGMRRNLNNGATFSVRGFSAGVARVDGFADAAGARSAQFDLAQVERLESVKGPTSVLFGFGNPGGVVNLVTKRPLPNARRSLMLEYGRWDRKRASLDMTGPLVDRDDWDLSYRMIATRLKANGFREFESTDSTWLSGQLQLSYRNKTTLRLGIRYSDIYEHEAFILMPFEPTRGLLVLPERSYNTAGPDAYAQYKQYTEFAEFTHTFSRNFSLRVAYSYDDHYYDALRRVGAQMPVNDLTHIVASGAFSDDKRHIDAMQLDLTGSWETRIGKLKAVVGSTRTKTDNRIFSASNNRLPQRLFPIFDVAARNYSVGSLSDYAPTNNTTVNDDNTDKLYYGLGTLETWKNRLTLLAAVGHGVSRTRTVFPVSGAVTTGKFDITKPQFGASLRLKNGVHLFGNFAESGAINNRFPDSPEQGRSFDTGIKVNFEKLSGSVAYFHTTRSQIQIQQFDGLTNTFTFFLSGEEQVKGLEFEAQYFPSAQLQVVGSYAYMDSEVISDDSTPGRAGTQLPNAPEHQFRVWTKYSVNNGPLNGFWAGLGVNYNAKMVGNFTPSAFRIIVGSLVRWDAAIGYTQKLSASDSTRVIDWVLNGENLTDRDYIAYQLVRGTPRSVKLSANFRF